MQVVLHHPCFQEPVESPEMLCDERYLIVGLGHSSAPAGRITWGTDEAGAGK